ncbi:hypothetical protein [Flagellimonas sp. 2504JD4-2]
MRKGTYTFYRGIEMAITECYGHGLNKNIEENYRLISYDKTNGIMDDFQLDESNNQFSKRIKINDLDNAFYIITKATFNGYSFFVELDSEIGYIGLKTDNPSTFEKMRYSLYKVNDEKKISEDQLYKTKYFKVFDGFIIRVKLTEITEMWEERSKSKYDLPMPDHIDKKKLIKPTF